MKTFIEDFLSGSARLPYPRGVTRTPGSLAGRIKGATVLVEVSPQEIYLLRIHVQKRMTGNRCGSKALRWLCRLADRHSFVVYLFVRANDHCALTDKELRAWYARYGFEQKGKWMVRQPSSRKKRTTKERSK